MKTPTKANAHIQRGPNPYSVGTFCRAWNGFKGGKLLALPMAKQNS